MTATQIKNAQIELALAARERTLDLECNCGNGYCDRCEEIASAQVVIQGLLAKRIDEE